MTRMRSVLLLVALLALATALKSADEQTGEGRSRWMRDAKATSRAVHTRDSKTAVSFSADANMQVAKRAPARRKLNVAFAVFVTDVVSQPWADALRVLAYSVHKAAKTSYHRVKLLALSPMHLPEAVEKQLLDFGFEDVLRKPVPVNATSIKGRMAREHMARVQGSNGGKGFAFTQADETIKYWGLALTDYDRVLVLDADTVILDPMDELMERDEDFVGVRDHGLDVAFSTVPPTQGGFLLFRPNMSDFNELVSLTTEGDWGGNGWKNSGIGYCYGGVGPDGLLTYHFNSGASSLLSSEKKSSLPEGLAYAPLPGSRMVAVDRAVYDLVINDRLMTELQGQNASRVVGAVKSVHFTGNCVKPWMCGEARDWLCEGVTARWWAMRAELEASHSYPATPQKCVHGAYTPLAVSP